MYSAASRKQQNHRGGGSGCHVRGENVPFLPNLQPGNSEQPLPVPTRSLFLSLNDEHQQRVSARCQKLSSGMLSAC